MTAIASQGVTLKVSIPGSPTSLVAFTQLTGFHLSATAPDIDVTDLDSSQAQVLVGVAKYTVTGNFNMDPDATQQNNLRNAIRDRTKIEAQVTLTDSTPATATFEGYVTSWEVNGSVNDKVSGSFGIAVNGGIVWA